MVVDERVEHAFGDLAFVGVELAQRLELELERLIGTAFGVPKDQRAAMQPSRAAFGAPFSTDRRPDSV